MPEIFTRAYPFGFTWEREWQTKNAVERAISLCDEILRAKQRKALNPDDGLESVKARAYARSLAQAVNQRINAVREDVVRVEGDRGFLRSGGYINMRTGVIYR